jgi:hypothetical protein
MPWQYVASAVFIGAAAFALWAIVHTIREALPRIRELLEELDQ